MGKLAILVLVIVLSIVWYMTSPIFWQMRTSMPSALGQGEVCRSLPPRVFVGDEPLQSPLPEMMKETMRFPGASMQPLAGFSMEARVLSRKDYRHDQFAKLSHVDLLVGWKVMADSNIVNQFTFEQGVRFGGVETWQGEQPVISFDELYLNASNIHLIPSNIEVAKAISKIGVNDRVRIDGWLVSYKLSNGWQGSSSMSRTDRGAGACEIIYVCDVALLGRYP